MPTVLVCGSLLGGHLLLLLLLQVGPVEAWDRDILHAVYRSMERYPAHSSTTIQSRERINGQLSTSRAHSNTIDGAS